MPNENEYLDQVEEVEEASFDETPTPTTLSEAFEILKKQNTDVGDTDQTAGETDEGNGEPEQDDSDYDYQAGESDDGGGSSDEFEYFDSSSSISSIVEQVQQKAVEQAYNEFKEKNYRKITVMDLRQEDEQGNVTYLNPDNQRRAFESRMEAQQWVDSFNQQVDIDFKNVTQKYQTQLLQSAKPTLQMLDFVPVYQKMTEQQQEIMDDIIEPYEIKASDGTVVGYRCDLVSAAKQAINLSKKIDERYSRKSGSNGQTQKQQPNDVSRPATDLNGHGSSGNSVGDPEPKNIQEAMALYQKQQKEKRSKQ